jgi:parallel beta-helix repeat protein
MSRRAVSAVMIAMLLMGILTVGVNVQPVSLVPLVPKVQAGLSSASLADTINSLANGVDWSNVNVIIQHTGYLFHRVSSPNYGLAYPNADPAFQLEEARLSELEGTSYDRSFLSAAISRCSGADQLPVTWSRGDFLIYYRWACNLYDWFPASWDRGTALTQFSSAVAGSPALDYPTRTIRFGRYYDEYMETADIYLALGSISDAVNTFEQDYSTHWNGAYWGYTGMTGIECEAGPFAMIAAKLYVANGDSLPYFDTVVADLVYKFLASGWSSPLWAGSYVCTHFCDDRERLENTIAAWAALQMYWSYFTAAEKATMVSMLTGNGSTTAWEHLMASQLYVPSVNKFILLTNDSPQAGTPNDAWTAYGLNALFLMGIVPGTGSLAIPLNEEFYEDISTYMLATNFGFDYDAHQIKIPVRAGTLHFLFGTTESSASFPTDGIYTVQFSSDWNTVQIVNKLGGLSGNLRYLPVAGGSPPPTETIYIRADGSIDPPTAPISSVDNVTYTLTDNIAGNVTAYSSAISVQRDNIIIDGAGYTLQGTGAYSKGVDLTGRNNVTIKNMVITSFLSGIWLATSNNNSVSENSFVNCGLFVVDSYGNVVTGNLVNGKPLVYLEDVSDYAVGDAGQVILVECNNVTVENLNLSNTSVGVELWETNNTTISGNNITANNYYSIDLESSSDNSIYHNNFVNNGAGTVYSYNSTNVWDDGYPSDGNYWSDYGGVDLYSDPYQNQTGSDGIGDIPYVIDGNNQDNYPLMKPYPWAAHDIGITNVETSQSSVELGSNASINVNVMIFNYGNDTEAINVTVLVNQDIISEMYEIILTSRNFTNLTFTWNTTALALGGYRISAHAWPVQGETDIADNTFSDGLVLVVPATNGGGGGRVPYMD